MKVGILINELNIKGGTTKQLHRLVEYLMEQGHEIQVITKNYDKAKCYPGTEKFNIKSFDGFFQGSKIKAIKGLFKMMNYIISEKFDVLNIHDNGMELLNLLIKIRVPKLPVIWQINDLPAAFRLANQKMVQARWDFIVKKRIARKIAKLNNLISVNVSKNARLVQEHLKQPASVFYCGVDLKFDTYIKKEAISKKISIVSTGVLFPFRNYENLLFCQKELMQEGYDVQVHIVGAIVDKIYLAKLKMIIQENNLNAIIHGDISEEQLMDLYKQVDLFFFLNIDQSWGLAIFEAMNMGIPTIISESVGAVELLENGENTIMVNPQSPKAIAEKVKVLINDHVLKDRIASNAFSLVSNMTWANMYCSKVENAMLSLK